MFVEQNPSPHWYLGLVPGRHLWPDVALVPDDEVIEHLDVEQLAGLDGLLGQPHIVG